MALKVKVTPTAFSCFSMPHCQTNQVSLSAKVQILQLDARNKFP